MDRQAIVSSTIAAVGYDENTGTLEVEFSDGKVYEYQGVPKDVYEAFMNSDSKGRFFAAQIRGGYLTSRT
jgi:hypothetical protein